MLAEEVDIQQNLLGEYLEEKSDVLCLIPIQDMNMPAEAEAVRPISCGIWPPSTNHKPPINREQLKMTH